MGSITADFPIHVRPLSSHTLSMVVTLARKASAKTDDLPFINITAFTPPIPAPLPTGFFPTARGWEISGVRLRASLSSSPCS